MESNLKRPYTLINMAMSVDGKISTNEKILLQFSSFEDRRVMDTIRFKADAILIGANTLRTDGIHLWIKDESLVQKRRKQGKTAQPINIVISKSLDIPTGCRFFSYPGTEKWIVTGDGSNPAQRKKFAPFSQIHIIPEKNGNIDLADLMVYLKKQGINLLLVEGGSDLNFRMIARNLIDELYLTICPIIIGGQAVVSPVGGSGFERKELRNLELLDVRQHVGELFLHYRFLHDLTGLQRRHNTALEREREVNKQVDEYE